MSKRQTQSAVVNCRNSICKGFKATLCRMTAIEIYNFYSDHIIKSFSFIQLVTSITKLGTKR